MRTIFRFFKKLRLSTSSEKYTKEFLENCNSQNRSPHTIESYRRDLEQFLHWLNFENSPSLMKVRGETIQRFQSFLKYGGHLPAKKKFITRRSIQSLTLLPLKISSQKRKTSTIKNFFEFLREKYFEEYGVFEINPVKNKIHHITLKDSDIDHTPWLTPEDWYAIETLPLGLKDELILYLLYFAGLRLREVSHIKKDAWDETNMTLNLIRKGGKRHVFIPQRARELAELWRCYTLRYPNDSTYLFVGMTKEMRPIHPRALYGRIKRILARANLKVDLGPHSFRKACATRLYKETKDLLFVRDYLNHSDAKVTQTYIETGRHSYEKGKLALLDSIR
jgi:integrase/recombinase XerD